MTTAIVIGSYRQSPWIEACLRTIPDGHEPIVYAGGGFELGAIGWVHRNTTLDEFLYLQDTVEILDRAWVDRLFASQAGQSVSVCACPCVYGRFLGKYRRAVLDKVGVPETPNKRAAIAAEREWTARYVEADPETVVLFPEFSTSEVFEDRHGRRNMVIENAHLRKFQGSWNGNIIE